MEGEEPGGSYPEQAGPNPRLSAISAGSWRDEDDAEMDSDEELLEELDEDTPHSLVCYVCFKKKSSGVNAQKQTVAVLRECMDYRHPIKVHRGCMTALKNGNRCIFCRPEIRELGDLGLCKLVVQMTQRALADRDTLFRGLFEIIRLTNTSPEHVVKLHEYGAFPVVMAALGAWPADLAFCLRSIDAVIALCQLPSEAVNDSVALGVSSALVCQVLREHQSDPEACIKAMTAMAKVAEVQPARNTAMLEQAGACPLIVEAMRRHKEKHAVQMTGMEAIRALCKGDLKERGAVVEAKLPEMFIETMMRYSKDRSIQLFCMEALSFICTDAESAGIMGRVNGCRASAMALAHFKADAEVQCAGCRVLCKLGGPHGGNRDKLVQLKAGPLVARAIKTFPKDRTVLLEGLLATAALCSAAGGGGGGTAAASSFGESGIAEAVVAALPHVADAEAYGAALRALSAVVTSCDANRARMSTASVVPTLQATSSRLALTDASLQEQLESLIRAIDSPLPSPARRGSNPPRPQLQSGGQDTAPVLPQAASSPRALSPTAAGRRPSSNSFSKAPSSPSAATSLPSPRHSISSSSQHEPTVARRLSNNPSPTPPSSSSTSSAEPTANLPSSRRSSGNSSNAPPATLAPLPGRGGDSYGTGGGTVSPREARISPVHFAGGTSGVPRSSSMSGRTTVMQAPTPASTLSSDHPLPALSTSPTPLLAADLQAGLERLMGGSGAGDTHNGTTPLLPAVGSPGGSNGGSRGTASSSMPSQASSSSKPSSSSAKALDSTTDDEAAGGPGRRSSAQPAA